VCRRAPRKAAAAAPPVSDRGRFVLEVGDEGAGGLGRFAGRAD
jgi:hypothetical protein